MTRTIEHGSARHAAAILALILCGGIDVAAQGTLSAISVTPSNGTGNHQSFAYLFFDSNGGTYITGLQLLITGTGDGYNSACDFWIDRGSSGIWLRNDANNSWGSPVIAGQPGTLQNSQCVLDSATSSILPSGNYLTVTLNITRFQAAYAGTHNITMEAYDAGGLHIFANGGTYTVTVNYPPSAISVTPANGSGTQQLFSFLSSDPNGGTDISGLQLLISGTGDGYNNACDFWIDRGSSGIWLRNDANNSWGSPVIAGRPGTLQNSQCILDSATSSITPSGNNLTVNLNITRFQPSYAGSHYITMEVYDTGGLETGGVQRGTYTVTTAAPDFGLSISPSSGTVTAGGATNYTVSVSALNGFNGVVSFQAPSGLPTGASGEYNPVTITGAGSTTLTISTTTNVQAGTYPFTVTGASGSLNHSAYASLIVSSTTYTLNNINDLIRCANGTYPNEAPYPTFVTCQLAVGTYTVSNTIAVARSNLTIVGGSSDRTQTKLVRDPTNDPQHGFTGKIISVGENLFTSLTGIKLQNLTVCGGSTIPAAPSPAGCPRALNRCGQMVADITAAARVGQPPPEGESPCTDVGIDNADAGNCQGAACQGNPFSNTGPYSVEISNVGLEDATGNALSLYGNGANGRKVNDIYFHGTSANYAAINFSGVTGILGGADFERGDYKYCDGYQANTGISYADASAITANPVYAPRNVRIEYTNFTGNHTAAIGMNVGRWIGIRNNTFSGNYDNPQVGNPAGGSVGLINCTDTLDISGNSSSGPGALFGATDGFELYGRNINLHDNPNITGYGSEGIGLHSVYNATVSNNYVHDNDMAAGFNTGGIKLVTSWSTGGCDSSPRDLQVVTLSGNTITGQAYGVHLNDQGHPSRNTLLNVAIDATNYLTSRLDSLGQPYPLVAVDPIVSNPGFSGPPAFQPQVPRDAPSPSTPMALDVDSTSWRYPRCSSPGTRTPVNFTFPAKDNSGASAITWVQGIFSIAPNDDSGDDSGIGGPDNGAQGCHFIVYPWPRPVLYLDGASGNNNWILPPSAVGSGGNDQYSNGYCTIHAASSQWTIEPYILTLTLDIEFPYSSSSASKKHIYSITSNSQNLSDGGTWRYWGWWATQ